MTDAPLEYTSLQQKKQAYAIAKRAELEAIEREFQPVPGCPLITPMTRFLKLPDDTLRALYAVRRGEIPELPPMPRLREILDAGTSNEKPLTLRPYQAQQVMHMYHMPRYVNGDSVGLGKAQPLTALVMAPTGYVPMGELRVGSILLDPDGGNCVVDGIFPQGVKEAYRVTFSDGSFTECCLDHLWTVQTIYHRARGGSYTKTLRELLDMGLDGSSKGSKGWARHKFFLPNMPPVEFGPEMALPLHPYALGVMLGDGCLRYSPTLSTPDEHIVRKFQEVWPEITLRKKPGGNCDWAVTGSENAYTRNVMRGLGLHGKYSHEKIIPDLYLYASVAARKDLLAGLMDTDGECAKSGLAYYTTTSEDLALQLVHMVRTLGGVARMGKPQCKSYTYNGEKRRGRPCWMVTVKTPFNPFTLPKKAERWKPQMLARAMVSAERLAPVPMQCISVTSKRHLYYTDDLIPTHNTLAAIAAACAFDHAIGGGLKMIVFTTTTTAYQWETEIKRFSTLNPWVMRDSYKFKGDSKATHGHAARLAQLQKFLEHPKLDVLVCRYSQWKGKRRVLGTAIDQDGKAVTKDGKERVSPEIRDFREALKGYKGRSILVLDETHKIKNPESLIRAMIETLQARFARVWGLTATAIKNHLEEFYSITSCIGVSPLGSLNRFREDYCIWEPVRHGAVVDSVITGYRHLDQFKVAMRPFYWGRSQAQVHEPMPKLTTVYHPAEMSRAESKLVLEDIPSGAYVLPPTLRKVAGEWELVERDPSNLMTMLSVMQLVANSSALLDRSDKKAFLSKSLSAKEEILLDLLDGDLQGEHVLCFTKYRSWIDRLEYLTANRAFTNRKFLRITGAETGKQRENNRLLFQDHPDYNFLMLNGAGIEGSNLQQAAHLICLDLPWSWGDFIQLVGRMVRMASPHSACTLHILFTLGTVDEYVIEVQKSKKGVFERILGNAGTAGILEEDLSQDLDILATGLEDESDDDFRDMLKAHAKTLKLRDYTSGVMLAKQVGGLRDYDPLAKKRKVTEEELDLKW